jgi:Na+/H+ antiporter NhaD/arsenite permease-like protein
VIAANAGGAWSPIGDVTTTMLWIGGQVSVAPLVANVFLPSVVCTSVAGSNPKPYINPSCVTALGCLH